MYLALYRKYRPQTFEDVISQEHITTTLKNQLKNGQTSHAYLFTGSRGTGKTTCAKILAKAINCLDSKDGNPCLKCGNCLDIEEGGPDITEIDAASNNGVDFIRDLKEEAVYTPITCKYRVYIIDEVHMLSVAAFNALLKLIEEPPPHVVFIFATTEVHKIPATILSRCQRFEFRRIDINDSKQRLLDIAGKEGKTLTDDAAFLISKISDGGMRDALSLLDQCFSVAEKVDAEVVMECAGISGSKYLFELADRIYEGDSAAALKILDGLINRSKDVTRFCEEMISHYRNLMLLKAGADNSVIRATEDDLANYGKQSEKYTLGQIMRNISILSETFSSLGRIKTPVMMVEMCLIRLCCPKTDTDEKALEARIDALERTLSDTVKKLKSGEMTAPAQKSEPYAAQEDISSIDQPPEIPEPPIEQPPVPYDGGQPSFPDETGEAPPTEDSAPFEIENRFDEDEKASGGDGFVPFPEWEEMMTALDFNVKVLIENTSAEIMNNNVRVSGSNLAVNFATGEFRQQLQEILHGITGRNLIITAAESADKRQHAEQNRLMDFLNFAKAQGVNIKEQ